MTNMCGVCNCFERFIRIVSYVLIPIIAGIIGLLLRTHLGEGRGHLYSVILLILSLILLCLLIVSVTRFHESELPPKYEASWGTLRRLTVSWEELKRLVRPRYYQVEFGFALLAGVVIFAVSLERNNTRLIFGAVALYAAIGFYLFSQGNTVYSLANSRSDPVLYDTAGEITNSAYHVAGGAAIYFILGVGVTQYPAEPIRTWLITAFSGTFQQNSVLWTLLQSSILSVGAALGQLIILRGIRKHRSHHLWFRYLKEFDEANPIKPDFHVELSDFTSSEGESKQLEISNDDISYIQLQQSGQQVTCKIVLNNKDIQSILSGETENVSGRLSTVRLIYRDNIREFNLASAIADSGSLGADGEVDMYVIQTLQKSGSSDDEDYDVDDVDDIKDLFQKILKEESE